MFGFSSNMVLCIVIKHLHFGLVCLKNIVPEVLGSRAWTRTEDGSVEELKPLYMGRLLDPLNFNI